MYLEVYTSIRRAVPVSMRKRKQLEQQETYLSLPLILSPEHLGITKGKQKGMWLGPAPSPVPI